MLLLAVWVLAISATCSGAGRVDYSGYKVLAITPKSPEEVEFLQNVRSHYSLDFWNIPRQLGSPVLTHLSPSTAHALESALREKNIQYDVTMEDLQQTILSEHLQNSPSNISRADAFDFGKYNEYEDIIALIESLAAKYPNIAKLETIGKSFENRPIYALTIGGGDAKKAVMMECGIHAREWTSVAACSYLVNRLVTTYESDPEVKQLVDKYEFAVVVESNPDGYVYTRKEDRLWRKTRSRSRIDPLGVCRGADANRNFDIEHCGPGTSRKPCEEDYCGDKPFSESEARALRDLMVHLGQRTAAFFSVHAFSQYWLTPYGTTKKLPGNYAEMERVANAGMEALSKKYGTKYTFGSITNVIYEAAGSSVDYAYAVRSVPLAYALELRDQGRHGFFLPQKQILPTCEETFEGIVAAVNAI